MGQIENDITHSYPLYALQHAMLLHSARAPKEGVYVQQLECEFGDDVDAAALRQAFQHLVDRHDVLRSSFHLDAGSGEQHVHASARLPFSEHDWRALDDAALRRRWRAHLRRDRRQGLRPEIAPLMRVALFRLAGGRSRLLWTSHHALFDAHARRLLLRELFAAYAAAVAGEPLPCAPVRPYREFIARLRGGDAVNPAFWRARLSGATLPTPLGIDAPRPPAASQTGRCDTQLSPSESAALHAFAEHAGVSMTNVVQAAWAMVLSRFSGRREVVFGVARVARRGALDGAADTVGLFANTLPLRLRVDEQARLLPWLRALREEWRALQAHEHAPLAQVQAALGLSAEQGLFASLVSVQRETLAAVLRGSGAAVTGVELHERPGLPLVVSAVDDECISLRLTYDRARLAREGVEGCAAALRAVLGAMAAAPASRLGRIMDADGHQHRARLERFNRVPAPLPAERRVHYLFALQAAARPQAPALCCADETLSYAELDARANRLARRLRARGLRADAVAAVCLERGVDLVVSLLAVLKAGAAYLPLDPGDPALRRSQLVDDAGAALVVTRRALWREVASRGCATFDLDAEGASIAGEDAAAPDGGGNGDSLACVMYTSGSTGRPKGVGVRHGAIARLLHDPDYVRLDRSTRTLLLAPVSFDASTFELWAPLLHGGCCVVYPERVPTLALLGEVIRAQRVNTLWLTASLFNAVVDEAPAILEPLTQLLTGGEALSAPHVRRVLTRMPRLRLVNGYGPTENTTFSCCHVVDRQRVKAAHSVPIGRPIAHTRAYVLDRRLQPVPPGVVGELYLAGEGLARGYLGRPGATAESFVPDPFGIGGRMYRSGDLARWHADGSLQFVGRGDAQIKLRGHRIEPAEIETVLMQHPQVRRAAVAVRGGEERLLTAYVVLGDDSSADASAMRSFLRDRLPSALVPSHFVVVPALPLTASGKIDRDALPEPPARTLEPDAAGDDALHAQLRAIWREVLGSDADTGADFFDNGGHSLQASRIVARINAVLGVTLPVDAVFEHPTIAALAEAVRSARPDGGDAPCADASPDDGAHALSSAQLRLWLHDRIEPGSDLFNIPLAFRIDGELDEAALRRALAGVVQRHEPLRTRFVPDADGSARQFVEPSVVCGFNVEDLRHAAPERRDALAAQRADEEARRPFDLAHAPLLRARLLRLDEARHLLLITLHHIIADGWSVEVLLREIAALYDAARGAAGDPLAPLPARYRDYVRRRGRGSAGSLAYWCDRLRDAPLLDLPADGERGPRLGGAAGRCVRSLPAPISEALTRLARAEGTTMFTVLLALFAVLLGRQGGDDDIVVGAPVAGRDAPELEGLVGLFLNTLPLRIDLSGDPTLRELLRRVRGVVGGGLAHQDVFFERIVEELAPARVVGRNPLFDVTLNFVQEAWSRLRLGEARVERVETEAATVKFDLTLYAMRTDSGLNLRLHYRRDLFASARMEAMMDQLVHLAEQAVADADAPLAGLSLYTPASRALLPDPSTPLAEPAQRAVTEAIAAHARARPQAAAVHWRDSALSYAELNARAEALAAALRHGGVRRGEVVAVHGRRCAGMVVAMLGVLRSGAVLFTVDADLPAARRDALLREARARWAVSVGAAEVPPAAWRIDADSGVLYDPPQAGVPPPHPDAGAPAYLFFTSGSTGRPKAVLGSHKGLAHFLAWQRCEFAVGERDRCAQLSALSFDAVLRDVFLPLTAGGALCVPDAAIDGGDRVVAWLNAAGVTIAHMVPSVAASWLVSLPRDAALPALRLLFFTGEPLTASLVLRWQRLLRGDAAVVNLYGPTETTLIKCFHRVDDPPLPGIQPVGLPLPDTQALVLNAAGSMCGVGERGEIFIRTPFRSLGYANDGEATQRSFVRNPFREDGGDLLYRSGDVGRYRPDGTLEVLGRRDDQVKIRGVRIEPGEVASHISDAGGVAACAVIATGEGATAALHAYVVPDAGSAPDAERLREHLRARLPAVMVPSAFVFLDRLPLLANGKVDRHALPAVAGTVAAAPERRKLAPMEAYLCALFAELLGVEQVTADSDFFVLGGNSLLAAQMVARLRADFAAGLDLAQVFAAATPAALAARLGAAGRAAADRASNELPQGSDALQLTLSQQRIWFVDQLAPQAAVYNIRFAYRISGELDVAAMEQALRELVRRHDALRARVSVTDGEPRQRLLAADAAPLVVEHVDLTGIEARRREARLRDVMGELARRPFDLASPPLLRTALIGLAPDESALVLVVHHLAADGWSMGVLVRELGELYAAYRNNRVPALGDAPSYRQFIAAERRKPQGGEREQAAIAFWRRRLRDLTVTELPSDRPRSARMAFRGGRVEARIAPSTAAGVKALARRTGATPFMVTLAAFNVLLWRYTGNSDVCVGVPEAGRADAGLERMVGLCGNTLVLRTAIDAAAGFVDSVAAARDTVLEALAHADAPFERIVEAINPQRDSGRSPLFQILFQYQHGPLRPPLALEGSEVEPLLVDNGSAKRDLSVFVQEERDGLRVVAEFDSQLFDTDTAQRLIGHYAALLGAAVDDPECAVHALPIMDPAERARLTAASAVSEADTACVHELFAEAALRWPRHTAVVHGDRRVSYAELDARSDRLARALRERGVRREDRVGLCAPRSPETIAAMLAVLKAGAAYVPLDPDLTKCPLKRLAADAGLRLVLVDAASAERLREAGLPLLAIDREPLSATAATPPPVVRVANLAYVMFTTGSSGAPKAVTVEHRQLVAYCRAARSRLGLAPGDRHALLQPLTVDSSVTVLWGALLSGGELHVLDTQQALDGNAVAAHFAAHAVDVLKIAPSHLRLLQITARGPLPLPRRCLVLGGEAPPRAWVESMVADAPGAVFNHYGPTETTVGVATWRCRGSHAGSGGVPLGHALDGNALYVLDRFGQPVPTGVAGEIYIGGGQLARGYLSAARTALRFLPDPFASQPGARMYRTGDRGRWRADGSIEFLGRMDAEVKIRGYRVDPIEIEELLRGHPRLDAAAVVVDHDDLGDARLLAYVTRRRDSSPQDDADLQAGVRAWLAQRLPAYLLPTVVELERLPLTAHGKLDRAALPAPGRHDRPRRGTAPRGAVEAGLAEIWRELVGVSDVDVDEDFFALGGHSLLGARLLARINQRFGTDIALPAVLEARTIAAQAQLVAATRRTIDPAPAAAATDTLPAPLSFGQQRLWFLDQLAPGLPSYNIGVVLRLRGRLNVAALESALGEIVRRHEVLRTTFQLADDEPTQVVTPAQQARLRLERIDLRRGGSDAHGGKALDVATRFVQRPFDLRSDLMLRAQLIREDDDRYLLCCALHHIASDGWSRRVFYRELCALYAAFDAGAGSPLPPLPLQYRDYARWQRAQEHDPAFVRQLAYWRRTLAGLPVLELPSDRPRPAVQVYDGARVDFDLPAEVTAGVESLARAERATPFMVFLAAYQVVLARRSGQDDFAVGAPVASRVRPEYESLIGFFVNTLALRARVDRRISFRELLRQVRGSALSAFENQDLPFERIVAELAPLRQLGRPPLVQVLLTVQNFPHVQLAFPDCEVEVDYARTHSVTFELNLILYRSGERHRGALLYNTALFDRDTAAAVAADFRRVLAAAATHPDAALDALLPVPGADAAHTRPGRASRGATPDDPVALIARQARQAADAAAITNGEQALSYAELWRRCDAMARALRRHGVGPEQPVGVHLRRGMDLPVVVLAVLRSGGVCVPLDPDLPARRLAKMAAIAGVNTLLSDQRQEAEAIAAGGRVIALADLVEPGGDHGPQLPRRAARDDSLAYILFTSGTSGEPKGVAMPWRGLSNLIAWQLAASRVPAARTVQFADAGFDVFFQELLSTLCAGGTLVVPRHARRNDFAALAALIEEQAVQRLFAPPVVLAELAEIAAQGGQGMASLREIVTAGERLQATQTLRNWLRRLPACRLVNQYGPTETHVATAYVLDADPDSWPQAPPIGQPISGVRVYLLDDAMRPVPVGSEGDVYVGGAALARGYAARPAFTAERFVPDPLSGEPGARLYRTGDRARVGAGGVLEFAGRSDAQVKIRGVRVEPGEIESAIAAHPAVSACVVRCEPARDSDPLLVAYVVGERADAAALRAYLAERLPPAMLPERLFVLASLPLNAHGKIDGEALSMDAGAAQRSRPVTAPQSPLEQNVLGVWREVLGASDMGPDDDFFECGGHSLKAARAVSAMRRLFNREVPLRWLFESRTARAMARRLQEQGAAELPIATVGPADAPAPGAGSVGQAVASVWRETLGRGSPRPDDDFFELGGHSLAAVRLASRLASRLGVNVPVRLLFEQPRFESFERAVSNLAAGAYAAAREPDRGAAQPAVDAGLTLQREPLLPLLIAGRVPRVDAAAISYFADESVRHCRHGRDAFLRAWCEGMPTIGAVTETELGRTAVIRLPWLASELYDDRDALVQAVIEALQLAGAAGARVVSLTGLIPSATGYGRDIVAALPDPGGLPQVTTGHATTAATVVMSVRRVLAEAQRALAGEHLAVLGLGSIGATALRLVLERLPHPARLTLCDVYARHAAVAALAERLRRECGYRGEIEVLDGDGGVPGAFYAAGVIVGATNVAEVLDVTRLRPGCLVVDDSGPHCFDPRAAIDRFEAQGDILFTEGGVLRAPRAMRQTRYRPPALDSIMSAHYLASLQRFSAENITGCVLSALLGARFEALASVIGEVAPADAAAHFDRLLAIGFDAAPLRCGAYVLDAGAVARFRERFAGGFPARAG